MLSYCFLILEEEHSRELLRVSKKSVWVPKCGSVCVYNEKGPFVHHYGYFPPPFPEDSYQLKPTNIAFDMKCVDNKLIVLSLNLKKLYQVVVICVVSK